MPRKKTTSTKTSKTPAALPAKKAVNKSAFIRAQPASLSAKEVVAKAKSAGFTVTDAFVYTIRSQAKKAKAPKGPKPAGAVVAMPSGAKRGRPPKSSTVAASHEQQVRKMALTIGIVAVESIVKKIKAEAGL